MAAQVTETYQPPILDDLDAPIRVGACLPGQETFLGAHVVIPWRGRLILGWTLGRKARDRRRKGTSESGSPTSSPWQPTSSGGAGLIVATKRTCRLNYCSDIY